MKRVRDIQWTGDRGEGSVFFFVNAETGEKVSANLYLSYRAQGREILVSAKTSDLADARRELKRLTRNRDNAKEGKEPFIAPKAERLTVGDLLDANLRRSEADGLRSLPAIRYRTETLKGMLGELRAIGFRPEHVDRYKDQRRAGRGTSKRAKVTDTSIRRELEILNRAFQYAVRRGALAFAPFIELPTIDNVSELEFPQERVPELLSRLRKHDEPLADLMEFLGLTARRPEGLRRLTWDRFDSENWTLTIPPEKKGNPVMIGLSGTLRRIIERRLAARRLGCDLIFHRKGKALGEDKDRKIFAKVCEEMELDYGRKGGFTIYTVKSTAIGLMHDAGLSDAEIKDRSGHRTDAMMRRYLKQKPERAHAASKRLETFLSRKRKRVAEKPTADAERIAVFPKVSEK
jgi:integrase